MTDIALGSPIDPAELEAFLLSVFKGCVVEVAESWDEVAQPFDLAVLLRPNPSEFPLGLEVSVRMRPGRDYEAWLRGFARMLAERFDTPVCCDGVGYGTSAGPYWVIVWKGGHAWLGSDLETTLGDGEGGPVKLIRKLDREFPEVPRTNELVEWVWPLG